MDERDKIIREDYPAERLPEDLRAGLGDVQRVRVTVEPQVKRDNRGDKPESWKDIKALIERARSHPNFRPISTDEAVARVRALRDEWDR